MNPRLKIKREDVPLFDFAAAKERSEFAHTHSRATDPATSYAAAASMPSAAETQRSDILAALRAAPLGLTSDEADAVLKWRPCTAGRRMHELVARGSIRATERTRLTRSGRSAVVYEVIP